MLHLESHELGPRLYVLGRRVHECHAGIALTALAASILVGGWPLPEPAAIALLALGGLLVLKDWRDLFPGRRDEAAWSAGMHRLPTPLRRRGRGRALAPVAGACTAAMGLVNLASALTPGVHSRMHLLLQLVPREVPVAAHALALSTGVLLIVLGVYLMRRRRRAWALAVVILVAAGALNLLKGLDIEEALASWTLAALLIWGRDAFYVLHGDSGWRGPVARSLTVVAGLLATSLVTLLAASHWGAPGLNPGRALAELQGSLTLSAGPIHYRDPFDWVPAGLALLWIGAALSVAWMLFRPLAAPRGVPAAELRPLARRMVERHGSDTLSLFKLRADKHHFFDSSQRAFVGYRIEAGVLLVSGDPVGPTEALPALLSELCGFAEARGLVIGVVGASEEFAELARGAGLSSFYIGDEAIVDLASFSLEGRQIRKVRQAVTRVRKAGYTAKLERMGELPEAELRELEQLSDRWRGDEPERGFSMGIDGLRGEYLSDSLIVVARDAQGAARGFLHFAPCYGRPAMSLGLMRRDRETVNGLTEYLVVSAIELLRGRGIEEISLNFAAFARLLRSPSGLAERILARLVGLANPYFQIESLYRFNAKFSPRWQPRYLLYERRPLGFARTGLAAMWAEGQLPSPNPRIAR
ncbi:MAG: phosphatidylglycerol lysyltransferase domain-containing protein [Solirubrobacterales bacterium]|nr:phosphatidylglycerol lysyltransferase domain-containing protein [Solirubrobacterales bacterium]